MKKLPFKHHHTLALIACCLIQHSTYAQDDSAQILDAIKVNARQWQEDSINAPVSSTVIEEQYLNNTNTDINIVSQHSANIALEQSSAQTRVSIRGISGIDNGLQDPVGYFVNGVALPLGGNQLPTLFNLKNIEIVKGPQGALYGRNTEAGAVKIESQDPTWEPSAFAEVSTAQIEGGKRDASSNSLSLGGANRLVGDTLAGSIALQLEDSEGSHYNDFDDSTTGSEVDKWSLSTGLTYYVSDNTDVEFKSIITKNEAGRNRFRFSTGPNQTDRFVTNTDTNGTQKIDTAIHSLKLIHNFEAFELTSITGLTDYSRDFEIDFDVTTIPLPPTQFDLSNNSLSQEIRLASNTEGRALKWLAGLYLYNESSNIDFSVSPMGLTRLRETNIDQDGQAIFGQLEYRFTPLWSASVGGRYESINQSGKQRFTALGASSDYTTDINQSEFLPKTSISFKPNAQNTIYLSYSKGYLPGGYNYNGANNQDTFTFDAEYSDTTELGWKSTSLSKRLNTSVTLFNTDISDKQIVDLLPGFVQSVSNIGEVNTQGLELGIDYQANSELSLYMNIGQQKSEAKSYQITELGVLQDLSGNELPYAPKTTYALGLHYDKKQGWFSHINLRGSSDYYLNSKNTLEQESLSILDADIGYQFKPFRLSFWGANLTGEEVVSRAVIVQGNTIVEDTLPKVVGLKVSAKL